MEAGRFLKSRDRKKDSLDEQKYDCCSLEETANGDDEDER